MNSPKKLIKYSFIFSIISIVANALMLVSDIISDVSIFYIVFDIIFIIASLVAVIGFAIFNSKPIEYSLNHKKMYITVVCFASSSSLILAVFAIMSVSALNNYKNQKLRQNMDNSIETEGKVMPTAEELTKRIQTLDEMLKNNAITKEEYDKLKQQILDELIK